MTSGDGPDDPDVGQLFDAALNASSPEFVFEFTEMGEYPYFCRPHFGLGMTGLVVVSVATPVEPDSWGAVKALYERR